MKKTFFLYIIPASILVLALNIAGHFLYLVLYSHVINPGKDLTLYQRHAEVSAPYITFVVGFVSMLFFSRFVSRRAPANYRLVSALLIPTLYSLIDIAIVVSLGDYSKIPLFFAISYAPYFVAAYVGAGWAQGPSGPEDDKSNSEDTDRTATT